jgi:hypothetical protein
MDALKIFQEYSQLGYKPIPLVYGTKRPIFRAWNKKYSYSKTYNFILNHPNNYNFGILLGNVIDIEGDSPEANDFLDEILKEFPHPCYSASKSKHHLFKNKNLKITRISSKDIELRAYNHQSVVPPSIHEDGKKYIWIDPLVKYSSLPVLPTKIEIEIARFKNKNVKILKPFSQRITCANCQKKCFINKRRLEYEILSLQQIQMKWMCNKCRPYDLREICRNIRKNQLK